MQHVCIMSSELVCMLSTVFLFSNSISAWPVSLTVGIDYWTKQLTIIAFYGNQGTKNIILTKVHVK